jgi:hypothetical protein
MHAGVRRRFRDGFVQVVLELFDTEEIDEMELEAIAALIINFGTVSVEEAGRFADALGDYEIDRSNPLIAALLEFLDQQLQSTE